VRVNLGYDANQQPTYRLAKIAEITHRTVPYMVDNRVETDLYLVLDVAGNTKQFKVSSISNGEFTPHEFERWMKAYEKNDLPFMNKREAQDKFAVIKKALNYVYAEDDVDNLVKARTQNLSKLPLKVLRQKKTEAKAQVAIAQDKNDDAEVARLVARIEELQEIIVEKSQAVEGDVSKVGNNYNERVREEMFKTTGTGTEHYYEEKGKAGAGNANAFVRRKTIQHVMHVGEEADRRKEQLEEEKKKKEQEEADALAEKKRKEEMIKASVLLSDIHGLKRKKNVDHDESTVLKGLAGSISQMEAAHDFELDLDI
jgi:hypothetical protein